MSNSSYLKTTSNTDSSSKSAQKNSRFVRKMRKLRNKPSDFFKDSRPYKAWVGMGSFTLIIMASLVILWYFISIASPRYAAQSQFVVKQAGASELPISGLASFGAISPTTKDSLIIKRFIESREMAMALDAAIGIRAHYQRTEWDWFSRLAIDATTEDFIKYYQQHIHVFHDEMSDVVQIEVQAFTPEFALSIGDTMLNISESFINALGNKMIEEQVAFAQQEVERKYSEFKSQQQQLLEFQGDKQLFSPAEESGALLTAINQLQAELIKAEARYKELSSVMRRTAPEVKAQKNLINSLKSQLAEERNNLISEKESGLGKANLDYQEIQLNAKLAADLYASSLVSLESVRAEAYRKLKHLLIVEHPALPEDESYPRRWYNIITWFLLLIIAYLISRLIAAIIMEHKE